MVHKECRDMNEKEMINALIDNFTNLQRIKHAPDKEKEVDFQLRSIKAKLEACGIITEELEMK